MLQHEQLNTEEKSEQENKENIADTPITSCEFSPREPSEQVSFKNSAFVLFCS